MLLVPTALSAMSARSSSRALEIRDTTGSTKYPVANPHQGKFRAEVSRYLSNSRYTGNSAKAWYLLADPNDLPVIEVAFLNGQESPDDRDRRRGLQRAGRSDARLPRLRRCAAGPARRREEQGRGVIPAAQTDHHQQTRFHQWHSSFMTDAASITRPVPTWPPARWLCKTTWSE